MTSTIKVNNIQNQCGANIINENSNTITIGASGDTIALASGASQTGFGREGSVDWQTSSIKTGTFTAVSGEGYFVDTSSGAVTANLPAGSAGAIVAFADYTRTFGTNALTVTPNGSEKIGGIAASMSLEVNGEAATLVYVDGTEGWINVQQTETSNTGNPFLVATGGTVTTSGNCKIHTFTGPGTFTVSQASSNCAAENIVSYLIVAGGGGGGTGCGQPGSGGGAGGFRELKSPLTPYTASPLDGYPTAPNRVTVTAQSYPIVVGAGGAGAIFIASAPSSTAATSGANSSFGGQVSAGGGKGSKGGTCYGTAGGSGSGGGQGPFTGTGTYYNGPGCAGAGNTPPTTPSQGFPGGTGYTSYNSPPGNTNIGAGGGGGATVAGADATAPIPSATGDGGAGAPTHITGSDQQYAGGGGGGIHRQGTNITPGVTSGGAGGGGNGGKRGDIGNCAPYAATPGTVNTGGGGGGDGDGSGSGSGPHTAGAGGSGIVVIRYKFK